MYHSILKSRSGDFIVSPDTFEKDLLYIKEKGYTTITMQDLINYVYSDIPLPYKPIIITLDDGHYNNLTYIVPILKKYNMKAVISIVGEYTNSYTKTDEANPNYSYLRWKDIIALSKSGYIEFQNHTYNLHSMINGRNGCMKKYTESIAQYSQLLENDIIKLQEEFKNYTRIYSNYFYLSFWCSK
ncbi:MAG: polysaccharide deacetylase family protein [Clostridia bacterium]|jgi:peptidoglycan/xylan/chitin deacetylase (PgdA/CDA1 family)|nr:polysaccharide deacetylase family protein [Clostridia bacterium]